MPQQQHHHPSAHRHLPLLMDPAQMGGHMGAHRQSYPGPSHFGGPGPSPHSVVTPLYPSMAAGPSPGGKRHRPDDLDLSAHGMSELEQGGIDSMQQASLGAAYAQTAAGPAHPTHHHHRLPDTGPPSKIMRREEGVGGGAPSVVGQEGMPSPAPRPRGPKLKFTPEDDQLLIDLKENKNLTWKQIADFFPGRSSGTLQVRYCTKLKAKTTQWTDETDQKLRTALQDYENEKWRIVANKVGTGFTPVACRERAAELMGENL
ncbi:Transcriptional activator Myb [Cytospora mali]|uniref:Transcriptional activator Myb n=1 Tax=Cytospora mali TaxID=578113 RepID=A0A194VLQ5_CYTMA|nr:Transcriptional activator Myb [Valsa mali]